MNPTKKSFWQKPEGITGILLIIGAAVGFYYLMPFIISLLANTIYAIVLGVVLLAIIYAILDPGVRTGVWYLFKMGCRALTGIIIRIDPIAIMEIYIADLRNKREGMNEQITKLDGELIKLKRAINDAKDEQEKNLEFAASAKSKNNTSSVTLYSREVGRQKDLIEKLTPLSLKMEAVKKVLIKMYENAEIAITDMTNEVRIRKVEYETVKRGYNALRSAMSIFKGDPDKKAAFDQSVELVESNISFKAAEMERFMRESQSVIDKIDIENGAFADEGLRMLDQMGNRSMEIMLAPVGEKMELSQGGNSSAPQSGGSSDLKNFDDLFDKK